MVSGIIRQRYPVHKKHTVGDCYHEPRGWTLDGNHCNLTTLETVELPMISLSAAEKYLGKEMYDKLYLQLCNKENITLNNSIYCR